MLLHPLDLMFLNPFDGNLGCKLGLLQKLVFIRVCTSFSIICFLSWCPKAFNALNGVVSSTLYFAFG
jgi:hypothetical protein